MVIFPAVFAGCSRLPEAQTAPVSVLPDASDVLTIVTFNIRYGTAPDGADHWDHRRDLVCDLLAGYRADVIGLQEALAFQTDQIGWVLSGYEVEVACRDDGKRAGEGCPIFYREDRFERLEGGTFWFSETPETAGSKHWGNTLPRICTWVTLRDRSGGGVFTVYNLHLDHQSQPSRMKSTELLADRIRRRPAEESVVVMGDFNIGLENPAMRFLLAESGRPGYRRLSDTWRAVFGDREEAGTFHAFSGEPRTVKIDHILVSEEADVLDAGIDRRSFGGRWPSDHFAVFAKIVLPYKQYEIESSGLPPAQE